MRIKIISNGLTQGTQVVNFDTGEMIENVEAIEWGIRAPGTAWVRLTLRSVAVELVGEQGPLNLKLGSWVAST